MAVEIITSFDQQCDASGDPMSGALVYVYDVGTTTLKSVYSDTGLSASAANPIVCDSAGRHDMRYVATGSYKIVVKTSGGTTVYTRDNVDGRVPVGSGALAVANGGTGGTTASAARSNIGAASSAELADIAADVAELSGTLASTEKTHIATGTTAQRPASPADGDIRHNTTTSKFEGYDAGWVDFVTSADIADQATMETGTSTTTAVSPGRLKYSPSAAKAWGYVTYSGGTPTLQANHNIASITDNGAGDVTFTFTTAISSANYSAIATVRDSAARLATVVSQTTAAVRVEVRDLSNTAQDPSAISVAVFGDL